MNPIPLLLSPYETLNARQRENYNAAKLAGILADFGFASIRLSDDWSGADLIAVHKDGAVYKIQLKGRFGFWRRYLGKGLYIAFREEKAFFVYPHDEILKQVDPGFMATPSWAKGGYSYPELSEKHRQILGRFRIESPL